MSEQEKVEMESVPLKTDTDTPAEQPKEEPAKVVPPKKTWFFTSTKKKTTEEDKEEKPKKKCFWQCKKSCEKKEEGDKQQMSIGIDLVERDEKNINEHVKLQFEDVFGEPEPFHSWDCLWRSVFRVFEWTRLFVYRVLTLIFGIPAAVLFGIFFGLFSAINTFVVVPLAKLFSIPAAWIVRGWSFIVSTILDPLTRSFSNCFSNVHVRKYGLNSDPTDLVTA